LRSVLDDDDLGAHDGFTMLLATLREDGWSHLTMVSVGEVVVVDDMTLRVAVWPGSTSAANIAATGRVTVAAVIPPTSYLVRVRTRPLGMLETELAGRVAAFEATVAAAAADEAPYAVLESGVRYRLRDPESVLRRWAEVRRALREATP
jgi:hypothetical protein